MAVHGILSRKLETMIMARDLFPTLRLSGELSPVPSGACWGALLWEPCCGYWGGEVRAPPSRSRLSRNGDTDGKPTRCRLCGNEEQQCLGKTARGCRKWGHGPRGYQKEEQEQR